MDVIRYLIVERKANVNALANNGGTPLMCACVQGHTETARLLVMDLQADIDIKDIDGHTALDYAIQFKHPQIIKILKNRKEMDIKKKAAEKEKRENAAKQRQEKEKEEQIKIHSAVFYKAMSTCHFCGNKSSAQERVKLHVCTGCVKVKYCSLECQRRDWRERDHKNICPYGKFPLDHRRKKGKEHRENVIAVTERRLQEKREQFPDRIFVFVPVAETPPFVSGWIPPVSEIDQPIWEPYLLDIANYT